MVINSPLAACRALIDGASSAFSHKNSRGRSRLLTCIQNPGMRRRWYDDSSRRKSRR